MLLEIPRWPSWICRKTFDCRTVGITTCPPLSRRSPHSLKSQRWLQKGLPAGFQFLVCSGQPFRTNCLTMAKVESAAVADANLSWDVGATVSDATLVAQLGGVFNILSFLWRSAESVHHMKILTGFVNYFKVINLHQESHPLNAGTARYYMLLQNTE